jgi:Alginate export
LTKSLCAIAIILLVGPALIALRAQEIVPAPAPDRSYKLIRSDEDWIFLQDKSLREDFLDPIKYVPLRTNAKDWYLTFGGEAREVWEQIGNDNWGQSPFWNGYLNERYMLSTDLHLGPHVRTFLELKSGINSWRAGGPRPIDEKRLDFQAGFLEVGGATTWGSVQVRAGRQELEYGSGRLVDVREGPNVRLSFDGFLARVRAHGWQLDGIAMRPDEDNPGFFNNSPDHAAGFWGAYATRPAPGKTQLDLYYLGQDRKDGAFERGTAHEVRQSIGGRISKPVASERPGCDFDDEALWQFGSFGAADIRAWTVATETGYRIPTIPLKPRFSVKADSSSGDHPATNTLGTFNPLYPKGNYFGVLATTGPGPINFIDVHPHVEASVPHNISLSFDWIFQWRQSLDDGVYAVPGFLIRAADGSRARFVGDRPGAEIRWQANRHLWFQGDYGIFYAGGFLKETQPGRNLNYWALWAGYKF